MNQPIGKIVQHYYYTVFLEEDRVLRIIKSGFRFPTMFHVIIETPYEEQEQVLFLNTEDVCKLIGCSEKVFNYALGLIKL